MGERLLTGLRSLVGRRVREARGRGLMTGVELRERAGPVVTELRSRGLVTVAAGPNVVRFLPPLTLTAEDVDEALAIARQVLAA
jgi:acetylornithine/succinyldiaminopimelate/putrescine aminotransferase